MSGTQCSDAVFQPPPVAVGVLDDTEGVDVDGLEAKKLSQQDEGYASESQSGQLPQSTTSVASQLSSTSCESSGRETRCFLVSVSYGLMATPKDTYIVGSRNCTSGAASETRDTAFQSLGYSQSLILPTLLKLANKKRPKLDTTKRRLSRIQISRITKSIGFFGSRTELRWLFRSFFKTCITLRDYGIEHRNISLENLAIDPRGRLVGKGIITSYDDIRDSPRQLRPCYMNTMPSKTSLTDLVNNPMRHNSLESLLLCLIWIVTTQSGTKNQKRLEGYSYRFKSTELHRWHSRDWGDSGRDQAKRRESVMKDRLKFENTVMKDVHPNFIKVKDFIRTLRALVYDPQWEYTRDAIGTPGLVTYNERCALIKTYLSIIEDASQKDDTALNRAQAVKIARSDKNTVNGPYVTSIPSEVSDILREGMTEEGLMAVKKSLGIF